jgi:hypothetical protein
MSWAVDHRSAVMQIRGQRSAQTCTTGLLAMSFDTALGAIVSMVVLIYLLAVLARPERF